MPYVPSKKTDGKSTDREILDAVVERLANTAADRIGRNLSLISVYRDIFKKAAYALSQLVNSENMPSESIPEFDLARAIYRIGEKYGYEGAYLGELNYAVTRFIQRVPGIMVERKRWEQELRYWLYAATVEALTHTAYNATKYQAGIGGVFEDIKDEYKRRVNTAYEAEQIVKSGDCYDAPYYTRLVKVFDNAGKFVGHMEVMLKRDESTLIKDVLDGSITLS